MLFRSTTHEKFDAITSDPLDPWVKGAAMLYTREFFELAKSRLNPGGVVTLFVQLYESNTEAVKSEVATFFDAFPRGTVWDNAIGYVKDEDRTIRCLLDDVDTPDIGILRRLEEIGLAKRTSIIRVFPKHEAVLLFPSTSYNCPADKKLNKFLQDRGFYRETLSETENMTHWVGKGIVLLKLVCKAL